MALIRMLATWMALTCLVSSCKQDLPPECSLEDFTMPDTVGFMAGFTTWPYAPTQASRDGTYEFLIREGGIYAEHLDDRIPWSAWINGEDLPQAFIDDVNARLSYRDSRTKLLLSVSLLNSARNDLIEDWSGQTIGYTQLDDPEIEDAYVNHLSWLIDRFKPDYLISAIEGNELLKHAPDKWPSYKRLMDRVRQRLQQAYPDLPNSESMTLHNYYLPDAPDPTGFIAEVTQRLNEQDFAAISFYPFFKALHSREDFQLALDFLHGQTDLPIAFVETAHLAEDLEVDAFNLSIPSDECEQAAYLETLFLNAEKENYLFIIWWAHRDFDELWETFPEEVQDLGKLWRDTGLLDEDGNERVGFQYWERVFR